MGRAPLAFIPALIALIACPARALAQDWSQPWADPMDRPPRFDVSASVGLLSATRWSDLVLLGSSSPATGALEQVLSRDVHVEPDTQFSAGATYWRGRYGFRARGGFSRSSLKIFGTPVTSSTSSAAIASDLTSVGIDTWLYDVGGAIGFVEYAPSRVAWPYGFIGLGGITYNLKQAIAPPLTFIDVGPSRQAPNTVVVADAGRQFLVTTNALSTETTFAVNIGLGTDIRIPLGGGGVGLRLEVADHLAGSPIALRVEELPAFRTAASDTGVRLRLVHHLSATAGLVLQIGR